MQGFILTVISNVAVAGILALSAFALTRIWRNPHLAHALWLLVLLKLVTPPIARVPVPQWLSTSPNAYLARSGIANRSPGPPARDSSNGPTLAARDGRPKGHTTRPRQQNVNKPSDSTSEPHSAAPPPVPAVWTAWPAVIGVVWLGGGLAWLGIFFGRYLRFRKLLAASGEADHHLLAEARRLANAIGLAKCPRVRVVDARVPPLVSSAGRPTIILLPRLVLTSFDAAQRQAVLVHELAHVRRRDHWVRWLEAVVLVGYWWNPIVWWASRQLRQAEEECCDAWVVWALPDSRRSYGQALLQTVEFLTEGRVLPAVAGSEFGGFLFQRRIEMILKQDMSRKMSGRLWLAVLLLGGCVLPVAAQPPVHDDVPSTRVPTTRVPTANERLEERVQRLEEQLKAMQSALKIPNAARGEQRKPASPPDFQVIDTPKFDAADALGLSVEELPAGVGSGLASKDYPLTAKEAEPLVALLEAFGNERIYIWAYDSEKGTASINTSPKNHRRIAVLIQLLRDEHDDKPTQN